MDAKKKAEDILGMHVALSPNASLHFHKQAALISIELLIEEHTWKNPISWNAQRKKYYEAVKKEIEAL